MSPTSGNNGGAYYVYGKMELFFNRISCCFLKENLTFTLLKKFTTILLITLGLTITAFAQVKNPFQGDNTAKVIKFYPNPATSAINFELARGYDRSYSLQLYNFIGRKIYETSPAAQRLFINLDGFFRGVYIYQLRDKYGKIVDSGKFQVIK